MRSLVYRVGVEGVAAEPSVRSFVVREAVSRGCVVTVEATSTEEPELEAMLGRRAVLEIELADGATRRFRGTVIALSGEALRRDLFAVHLEFAAGTELLKLGKTSRIFQGKSVKEIVGEILDEAGLGDSAEWTTTAEHAPREYVVQYGESDHDFVQRLLSEEGIGHVVRNTEDAWKLVFFDDAHGIVPIEGATVLRDREATGLDEDVVSDLREVRAVSSDEVMLRDYSLRQPSLDLSARVRADGSTGHETYVHAGGFQALPQGTRLARRVLERLRVGTRTFTGQSDCPRLEPGRLATIEAHPRADLDGEVMLLEVVHEGHGTEDGSGVARSYENRFTAIPSSVPYRPRDVAAKPRAGVQVAFVTAPPGEEIHTEPHGRVKVRFPWDRSGLRDDRSSTWLRVGQVALGGSMVLPRRGFEVLVDHELGDIDRPMVTGHLYNGEHRVPYGLPGASTRSSIQSATLSGGPGANELRFEDSAGAEEIFVNASRDWTVSVEHDASWMVSRDESCKVGSNHVQSVGGDRFGSVKLGRTLHVGASQSIDVGGDLTERVGGSLSISIGAVRHVQVGGDHAEGTAGTLTRSIGAMSCVTGIAGYQRKVKGNSTVTVGAAWAEITGKSRASTSGGNRSETIAALKLVKAKQMAVSCGASLAVNAGAMTVKCGGGRTDSAKAALAISAGGGMRVRADNIVIEGKDKLVVVAGACTISLAKSGSVKIRAPSIDLTGVKSLAQVLHRSN